MKAIALGLLLMASSITLSADPATAQAEKILPYPIYQPKLDNGLNVVTVPFDSPGLAAFYIITRVGSRNEVEPGVTGINRLVLLTQSQSMVILINTIA